MGKKVKKFLTNKIFTFILGGIIFSAVSVYAVTYFPSNQVTYDNGASGLKSTDVQGALDELYNTCQSCSSAASGDYIYFTSNKNSSNGNYLYKVSTSGGMAQQISIKNSSGWSLNILNFSVVNDYIYFTSNKNSSNGNYLYKVSTSGGRAQQISIKNSSDWSLNILNFSVVNDYIYFTSNGVFDATTRPSSNENYLYKVSTSGGRAIKIDTNNYSIDKVFIIK